MAGWRGAGRTWVRRLGVLAAVAALLAGVAEAPGQAAAGRPSGCSAAAEGQGRCRGRQARGTQDCRSAPCRRTGPGGTGWPAAAQASITLRAAAAPLTPAGQAAQRTLGSQGLVARGDGHPGVGAAAAGSRGDVRVAGAGAQPCGGAGRRRARGGVHRPACGGQRGRPGAAGCQLRRIRAGLGRELRAGPGAGRVAGLCADHARASRLPGRAATGVAERSCRAGCVRAGQPPRSGRGWQQQHGAVPLSWPLPRPQTVADRRAPTRRRRCGPRGPGARAGRPARSPTPIR